MDNKAALDAFSALSQETRLTALRALVEQGRTGLAAGDLADQLSVPHNTLSFHLAHLERAGLVHSRRNGRQVIYMANFDALQRLGQFLLANCCIRERVESSCCPVAAGGHPG